MKHFLSQIIQKLVKEKPISTHDANILIQHINRNKELDHLQCRGFITRDKLIVFGQGELDSKGYPEVVCEVCTHKYVTREEK